MTKDKSKITVVIATKNEGQGLKKIIRSVKPYAHEIIVVDGNSTDDTKKIARSEKVRFMLDHGLGRGDAVKMGLEASKTEVVVLFDADGSHEPEDIPRFISPILRNQADFVIGSRRKGGSFDLNMNFMGIVRSAGSDFLVVLVNHRFKTNLSDILYSFRAIRKSTAEKLNLTSNDFGIEQEMVVKCVKQGFKLLEIPSREKARAWGESKLKTLMGVKFVFALLKELYF